MCLRNRAGSQRGHVGHGFRLFRLRQVPPAERKAILASEDFQDFFARTTRVSAACYPQSTVPSNMRSYRRGGWMDAVYPSATAYACTLSLPRLPSASACTIGLLAPVIFPEYPKVPPPPLGCTDASHLCR